MLRRVSVPSFGDSFFISAAANKTFYYDLVSVPSFGDSFFIRALFEAFGLGKSSFRPLIRGFFFYLFVRIIIIFSVLSFRPLIRGFFFYLQSLKM